MNWILLQDEKQLDEIKEKSKTSSQIIFKHSTRCSISSMAKNRLERSLAPEGLSIYFLDLLKYRNLSNLIATEFNIPHQSPQILIIDKAECSYDESHSGIDMQEIIEHAIAA